MTIPRFQPGQPIRTALNARVLDELAREAERRDSPVAAQVSQSPIVAMVRNNSEEPINIYSPVGIGDCLNVRAVGVAGEIPEIIFEAVDASSADLWGVAQKEILPSGRGPVLLLGQTWVWLKSRGAVQGYATPGPSGSGVAVGAGSGRLWVSDGVAVEEESRLVAGVLLPGGSCVNTWWLSDGATDPAGGTISFELTINGVTDEVTFSIPSTITQTITALELHSEIGTGDVTIVGGKLPEVAQRITFKTNPSNIELSVNSLTPSWDAPPTLRWEPA